VEEFRVYLNLFRQISKGRKKIKNYAKSKQSMYTVNNHEHGAYLVLIN